MTIAPADMPGYPRAMDTDDARGVLLEWMAFLADAITGGMVEVGGEVRTDVTSGAGHDYRVHVRSAPGQPGRASLTGRIHTLGTDQVEMLEERDEADLPDAGPADAPPSR